MRDRWRGWCSRRVGGRSSIYATVRPIDSVSDEDAASAAASLARSIGVSGEPRDRDLIMRDQWTVAYNRGERPIHMLEYDDSAGTVFYISSTSGKALQVTQSSQRFWNWLGAVPHWLVSNRLEATHVRLGAGGDLGFCHRHVSDGDRPVSRHKELRRRQGRMSSPHRGLMYWHHVPGLVFGALVLDVDGERAVLHESLGNDGNPGREC